MKKEVLFILFLVGLISSLSVYAWPNSYPSQLINSQGYYKTNATNATWQPILINPMYAWQPVYRNATWIGGYGVTYVSYSLPYNAAVFAAYGCCSNNTNSSWYAMYGCYNVTTPRYRVQEFGEFSCGWNIDYSQTNQTNYICTDSDGGINYQTYGYAVSNYNGTKNDTCSSNYVIKEAYCSGYSSSYSIYNCQSIGLNYICSQGRCMIGGSNQTNYTNSCTDTDGGFVPLIRGTVSGYLNQNPYSYIDSCQNSNLLREYYCSGTYQLNSLVTCSYMSNLTNMTCSNGACIPINLTNYTG
ncbi:MAG: hypothetical protein V1663_04855 [archaeon]